MTLFDPVEYYMRVVDEVVYNNMWRPLNGWHDDYLPGSEYLPAIQQDSGEFRLLLQAIIERNLVGTKCLQLGLGDGCSHEVWQCIFREVWSMDNNPHNQHARFNPPYDYSRPKRNNIIIGDTHGSVKSVRYFFEENGTDLVDFLFIDAGHLYSDVRQDYEEYSNLVRHGGIIAFHDALKRDAYPGIEVYKFLEELNPADLTIVGKEVGTAWMVKR